MASSSLVKTSRPRVDIELTGQESGFVPSYTTWDRIHGTATVEADRDTYFDDIVITFQGGFAVYLRLFFWDSPMCVVQGLRGRPWSV